MAIYDELEAMRAADPTLEVFFDESRDVARQLGFKRTGDRIKQKISEGVESLNRESKIGREDGRLQVVVTSLNVS